MATELSLEDECRQRRPPRWPLAVITGAAGGLGATFARQLAARGFQLLLTDVSQERLEQLARQLRQEFSINVECIAANLCSADELEFLSQRIAKAINLELLVNCAGFGGQDHFASNDRQRLLAMMQVHITASVALTRAALPGMIERDCGQIINVSSALAYLRRGPTSYCASKRFLVDFSERLQAELSQTNVRIQALCPGVMRTTFFDDPIFKQRNFAEGVPDFLWSDVEFVVATSLRALRGRRVVCIPGRFYAWVCALANSPVGRWLAGVGRRRNRIDPQPAPFGLIDRDVVPTADSGFKDPATMKHVVVTGVSTGIGRSAAQQLARRGFHVFGTVRKAEDAQELQTELGEMFSPLVCDVCDENSVSAAAEQVKVQLAGKLLWGLVNNAGVALVGPLMHLPLEQVRNQMEVNVVGLIGVTQAFLPLLGATHDLPAGAEPGRIVNVSSISGILPLPMFGAYAASKHAVEALSRVLRTEVAWYKIPVIIIEPGPIESPIWSKMIDVDLYKDTDFEAASRSTARANAGTNATGALPVTKASQAICRALTDKRPQQRYVVNRYPFGRKLIAKWLPQAWVDRLLLRQFQKVGSRKGDPS